MKYILQTSRDTLHWAVLRGYTLALDNPIDHVILSGAIYDNVLQPIIWMNALPTTDSMRIKVYICTPTMYGRWLDATHQSAAPERNW